MSQEYELHDWAHKLGVSKEELKVALKAVGDKAADVQRHLRGSKPRSAA